CGTPLTRTFVDIGMSPLCESYISADHLDEAESFYPLHVRLCESCLLVQLPADVPGEDIFSDYAYFSSYSDSSVAHARRCGERTTGRPGRTAGRGVPAVASNAAPPRKHFGAGDPPVVGREPAANVAEVARSRGVRTESRFLGPQTGRELAGEYGRAD